MHPHLYIDLLAWAAAFPAAYLANYLRRQAGAPLSKTPYPIAYYACLAFGAIVGAFGFGTLNLLLSGQPEIGRSIIGALTGGIIAIEIYKKAAGISASTGGAFVAAFGVGVCIGRIGCFASGLEDFTHGIPTDVPWAVDFGDDTPRHPVQLYEAAAMGLFTLAYLVGLKTKRHWAVINGFYWMVLIYSAQRFLWEFLKPYGKIMGPFDVFHFATASLVAYALYMLRRSKA